MAREHPVAPAPSTTAPKHVTASLHSEATTLKPGTTAWVAVDFKIEKGWHLYWNGLNDSGSAPQVKWKLPPGFKAGEMLWPAPTRHISPGDVLDHIYENGLVLLTPISVPADAALGTVTLTAESVCVVCREACVLETPSVSIQLEVSSHEPTLRTDDPTTSDARKALPKPLKDCPDITARVDHGHLVISAPGATMISYFPTLESATTPDLIHEGEGRGPRLTVTVKPDAAVHGIVTATYPKPKESTSAWIEIPQKP